jgi:hypothetical protein
LMKLQYSRYLKKNFCFFQITFNTDFDFYLSFRYSVFKVQLKTALRCLPLPQAS